MSAKKREEIRHDWFAEKMILAGKYFNRYRRQFIIGAIGFLALVSAIFIAVRSKSAAEENRWQRIHEAENLLAESIYGMDVDGASFDTAVGELRAVYQSKPSSAAGLYALYQVGEGFYEVEKYAEAVDAWKTLIQNPAVNAEFAAIVENSILAAHEQLGNWSEAAAIYRRRAESAAGDQAAKEWWNLARCLVRMGDEDKAAEARAKAVELGKDSIWGQLAKLPSQPEVKVEPFRPALPPDMPDAAPDAEPGDTDNVETDDTGTD